MAVDDVGDEDVPVDSCVVRDESRSLELVSLDSSSRSGGGGGKSTSAGSGAMGATASLGGDTIRGGGIALACG